MTYRKFVTFLLSAFSALALLLAAIGLYGIIAYSVAQRTPELGIRMAVGALPLDIVRLVLRQTAILAVTGIIAGGAGAFFLSRFLKTQLYGVTTTDPLVYVGMSMLLAAVTALASFL